MATRTYPVNLPAWNADQLSAQLETATGLVGLRAAGTSALVTVDHPALTAAQDPTIQAVLTAYVFDADYGMPPEQLNLRGAVATLRQWAADAAAEVAAWDGQTTAQRNAAVKIVIQRLGLLMDRMADLLTVLGRSG